MEEVDVVQDANEMESRERASSAGGQQAASEELKEKAANLGGVARDQLKTQLSSQKGKVATQLGAVSDVLEQTGQQLRQDDRSGMADYPETAAQQLRKVSEQLGQMDVDQLVRQAQQMARERPALFLGAAFGLGLLGARFLKSAPARANEGNYQVSPSSSMDDWSGTGRAGAGYGTSSELPTTGAYPGTSVP